MYRRENGNAQHSYPRIKEEVAAIFKQSQGEPTFEDTVLEGKERHYTIINELDVEKYLNIGERQELAIVLDRISKH
ncbi:hypothetical protein BFZC1_11312 [Lysinibacillus fusiformis ZC1]|nr:hypothetical protein BFZC1_11312 [Lysinibacillus fusiformis ZC1]